MASCSNVLYKVERCSEVVSNIRKGKYRPATTTTTTTPTTAVYVKLRGPPLDSEAGRNGELWSETNILYYQN